MAAESTYYRNETYTPEDYDDLQLEFLKNDIVQLIKKKTIGLLFKKHITIEQKVIEMFQLFRTYIPQMSYYKGWFNREGDEIRIINRVLEKEDFVKILKPRMEHFLKQFSEGFDDKDLGHMKFLSKFIDYFVLSIKQELEKIHYEISEQIKIDQQQTIERLRRTLEEERHRREVNEEASRKRREQIAEKKRKDAEWETKFRARLADLRSGGRRTIRKSRKTKTKKSSKKSRKIKCQKSRRTKRRVIANKKK